tara:strand:- start:11 stop:229 length:219 start_codon:yes stop_codon:yes gene_type:complete
MVQLRVALAAAVVAHIQPRKAVTPLLVAVLVTGQITNLIALKHLPMVRLTQVVAVVAVAVVMLRGAQALLVS